MRPIRKYTRHITDEVNSAVSYAEKSVLFAASRPNVAAMYAEMAHDELKHAGYLRKIGETMLNENQTTPETLRLWSRCIAYMTEQENAVHALLNKEAVK